MAMEKEDLLKRVEKKNIDIQKIEKRIAKWSKGLRPEDIEIVKPFGEPDCIYGTPKYSKQYELYKQYKDRDDIPKSDDWNKGPNFYELYSAYRDLGDNKATLQKYLVAIDKIDNFAKEEKIKVIWDFLTEWENMAFNWYLVNAEKYFDLMKNEKEAWETQKSNYIGKYSDWKGRPDDYRAKQAFLSNYYRAIDNLTINLTNIKKEYKYKDNSSINYEVILSGYEVDKARLSKILKDEKQRKYEDLINRVTKITGIITDASRLEISPKGNLDGVVVGEKGKAKVETVGAGGYNVQCFHYRVYVNPIR